VERRAGGRGQRRRVRQGPPPRAPRADRGRGDVHGSRGPGGVGGQRVREHRERPPTSRLGRTRRPVPCPPLPPGVGGGGGRRVGRDAPPSMPTPSRGHGTRGRGGRRSALFGIGGHVAKKRSKKWAPVAGDAFAVPLEGGRFAVCRVLEVDEAKGMWLVANS